MQPRPAFQGVPCVIRSHWSVASRKCAVARPAFQGVPCVLRAQRNRDAVKFTRKVKLLLPLVTSTYTQRSLIAGYYISNVNGTDTQFDSCLTSASFCTVLSLARNKGAMSEHRNAKAQIAVSTRATTLYLVANVRSFLVCEVSETQDKV